MKEKYTLDIWLEQKHFIEGEVRGLYELLSNLRNLLHSLIINESKGVEDLMQDILNRLEEIENTKPKELKLEVGKYYQARVENEVCIYKVTHIDASSLFPVIALRVFPSFDTGITYRIERYLLNGRHHYDDECSMDLVKEVSKEYVKKVCKL
jgi:hypothetical protein